jgi:hypothetical protein
LLEAQTSARLPLIPRSIRFSLLSNMYRRPIGKLLCIGCAIPRLGR